MRGSVLVGILAVSVSAGCAGIAPAQVGQTAGTIAGAAIVPGVGAPIGALVGLVAGMLVQGQVDKGIERRERRELSQQLGAGATAMSEAPLASPQGEPIRVWIDETFHEGRLVAGHFDTRFIP
jgi:hypothetical protein